MSIRNFRIEQKGSSKKRLCYIDNVGTPKFRTIGFLPFVKSHFFEFHIRIKHGTQFWSRLGICPSDENKTEWFGSAKTKGWSIGYDGYTYHNGKSKAPTMEKFGNGDVVGMIVNKEEEKIYYVKNGKNLGSIITHEGIKLPEEVQICVGSYQKDSEFELVYFRDHALPPPPEETIVDLEKKMIEANKKMSAETDQKIEEVKKLMNQLMQDMKVKHDAEIISLKNENKKLKEYVHMTSDLWTREVSSLRENYNEHNEKYHTVKYLVDSIKLSPEPKMNEKEEFVCFEGKYEIEMKFSVFSGGSKDDNSAIDFATMKIFLNNDLVKDINRMPRSIELEIDLQKAGENELLVEYENIKKSFIFKVCSSKVSEEKTEVIIAKENSDIPGEEFKVADNIQFLIKFKNEEEMSLPFENIPDLDMSYVVTNIKTKKKVSRGFIELDEENFLSEGEGMLVGGSIKMKKGEEVGQYQLVVIGREFTKKTDFSIIKE